MNNDSALLYFRGGSNFPLHPKDAIGRELCVSTNFSDELPEFVKFIPHFKGLKEQMVNALTHITTVIPSVKKIYTVHPRPTVGCVFKWFLMSNFEAEQVSKSMADLNPKLIDLCEVFYQPAILPIDWRQDFSVGVVQDWVDIDIPKEFDQDRIIQKTLVTLCQKAP